MATVTQPTANPPAQQAWKDVPEELLPPQGAWNEE